MHFAIKSADSGLALGRLTGDRPEVVQDLPVQDVRAHAWSADRRHLAVLDLKGKRLQLFDLDGEVLIRRPDPPTLPKNSFGICVTMDGGTAYIGGGTRKAPEALWQYDGADLLPVPLPGGMGVAGKGIDHLFIDGDRLVAVDDIVMPKFILTFRLQPRKLPPGVSATRLEQHNSYERVSGGATGRSVFALYSQGINRGTSTAHLSILSKATLKELVCYSVVTSSRPGRFADIRLPDWWRRPWDQPEPPPKHGLEDGPLNRRPSMAFVDDTLMLGTDAAVYAADMNKLPGGGGRPVFRPVEAVGDGNFLDVQAVGSRGCVVAQDDQLTWLPLKHLISSGERA